jgi:hypothetical protein
MLWSTCTSIIYSGSVIRVNSNTAPAQTLVLNTPCLFDEQRLIAICHTSEERPASIHGQ